MENLAMILLAVAGGACLSMQAAANGRLGASQGVLRTAFLTFAVGTVVSAILVMFLEPRHSRTLFDVEKWRLSGSFLGLIYVLVMVFAVQRIGTAVATVTVILGQLAMSMLIDTFGWLGNLPIPFSPYRLLATLLLALALWCIYTADNSSTEPAA